MPAAGPAMPIRTVIVCEAQVPFVEGGAEYHVRELVRQLRAHGYRTALVSVPFKWYPKTEILPHAAAWRLLDLSESNGMPVDLVIGTKFPSYFARHPRKVTWLIHQYRAAYELAGTPYEVELTLLGSQLTAGRADPPFARLDFGTPPQTGPDRAYYPETGHFLAYGFKAYWEANGGLYAFGYPISEEFSEPNPDTGETYTVQYFERARFEWHPEERGTPYEVLLGRLGAQAATLDGIETVAAPRRAGTPDYAPSLFLTGLRIPVLMYHNIGPAEGRYEIPLWKFEQQLDWLRDNGYTTVTISQVFDYMEGTGVLPERPVVLTFDDAYASQWDAAAALDARGMHGVFFITAAASGLNDWQLRAMADRGHEIGSRSLGHPDLTTVSAGQLYTEVADSKAILEGIIGRPVSFFAYPYGAYDGRAIDAVASSGYRGGIAAWGGQDWSPDKRWVEPRVEVSGTLSIWEFVGLVQ